MKRLSQLAAFVRTSMGLRVKNLHESKTGDLVKFEEAVEAIKKAYNEGYDDGVRGKIRSDEGVIVVRFVGVN